jgi:Tol biopolymer transport system component
MGKRVTSEAAGNAPGTATKQSPGRGGQGLSQHDPGGALRLGEQVRTMRLETDGRTWQLWLRHGGADACEFTTVGGPRDEPRWAGGRVDCGRCGATFSYAPLDLTWQSRVAQATAEDKATIERLRQKLQAAHEELAGVPERVAREQAKHREDVRLQLARQLNEALARVERWGRGVRRGLAAAFARGGRATMPVAHGASGQRQGQGPAPEGSKGLVARLGPRSAAAVAGAAAVALAALVALALMWRATGGPIDGPLGWGQAGTGLIAFSSPRAGGGLQQVWLTDDKGRQLRSLFGEVGSGQNDTSPALSPDGRWIAFERRAGERTEIYVAPADPAAAGRVWRATGDDLPADKLFPSWHPDGKRLAFASTGGPGGTMNIYTVNVEQALRRWGTPEASTAPVAATRLTDAPIRAVEPAFSGDGEWLAYTCNCRSDQPDRVDIYAVQLTTGGQQLTPREAPRPMTNHPVFGAAVAAGHPQWSPVPGGPLAFHASTAWQPEQVWLVDPDGSNPRMLPAVAVRVTRPTWSPDGTRLAVETRSADGREQGVRVFTWPASSGTARSWLPTIGGPLIPPDRQLNPQAISWSVRPAPGVR